MTRAQTTPPPVPQAIASYNPTQQQISNLRLLANYLYTLPPDYKQFRMDYYYTNTTGKDYPKAVDYSVVAPYISQLTALPCNTCACAVGHAQFAGIKVTEDARSWYEYSLQAFGTAIYGEGVGEYMFGESNPDNHYQAADRIMAVITAVITRNKSQPAD